VFEPICLPARPENAKNGDTFGGGGEASAARDLGRQEEAGARRQRPARVLAAQPGHDTTYLSLGHLAKESATEDKSAFYFEAYDDGGYDGNGYATSH
jgi:hypothetical protein